MSDANLSPNTINAINQLEYTRTTAPNFVANGLGMMYSSFCAVMAPLANAGGGLLNLNLRGLVKPLLFFGTIYGEFFGAYAYNVYTQGVAQGLNFSQILDPMNINIIAESPAFIECMTTTLTYTCIPTFAIGMAYGGYCFLNQLPANYNMSLGFYNANYFNSVHTKASSYFSKINNFLTKNICFENGANVSVEELDNLYLGFHLFCHPNINNGFDINDTSHHNAFLNFIASNNKFDNLLTLVRLGASKQDCENKTAVQTVKTTGLNEKDFPVNKSLTWLAARAVSAQYADKDLELNETQSKIVRESREYEKFTF